MTAPLDKTPLDDQAHGWSAAICAHARVAWRIHPEKMPEVERACGFTIKQDGTNNASSKADADAYLAALGTVLGPIAVASARMAILTKVRELHLLK